MELVDFLRQTQSDVRSEIGERLDATGNPYPYPESVFAEVVMQHMSEIGMTFEPQICHYAAKVANATLRLSGYAVSSDVDQLDLFVSLYAGVDDVTPIPDADTKNAMEQCLRFLKKCAEGKLAATMDESNDAYALAVTIQGCYATLDQIRVYVLTDRQAKAKNFKAREINGKTIKLEVMDIERLHRHWSEGKPRDDVVVNFTDVCGGPLPCVYVPGEMSDYDYAMTAIPGEALRFVYEKYGARLLEANVRSFLSATGKVNKGIRDTLKDDPERFMAYNNGIVLVADKVELGLTADGGPGILWLQGMQIVNGGQTTASIYFTKKKNPEIDLRRVRVPTKIIILRSMDGTAEEAMISDISKFANSQNSVKQSDLSANKPFHIEMERLSLTTYCPNGVGRWFYERAAGSYNVMLMRDGTTPARLKTIKDAIPTSRRIKKEELAKYVNAWDQLPVVVSEGYQANFKHFMASRSGADGEASSRLPDLAEYKQMIAKAILFKKATTVTRQVLMKSQGYVATYLVSLIANRLGAGFDFNKIWQAQDISPALQELLARWATQVNDVMETSAGGRLLSEWAQKEACWDAVRTATYSAVSKQIPEVS